MPYVGTNVRKDDVLVQVKLHGPQINIDPTKYEKVRESVTIILRKETDNHDLAEYVANQTATLYTGDPEVLWVEVDVATSAGYSYGFTKMTDAGDEE